MTYYKNQKIKYNILFVNKLIKKFIGCHLNVFTDVLSVILYKAMQVQSLGKDILIKN